MALSASVINSFVDITAEDNQSTGQYAYGTAIVNGDYKYVQLDGSGVATALSLATDVANGDRIMVYIENHTATVVGNMTCPSSGRTAISVSADLLEYKELTAEYFLGIEAQFDYLDTVYANIYSLFANYATIEYLQSNYILAETVKAEYATISDLTALRAYVETLEASEITVDYLETNYATINRMDVAEADIADLTAALIEVNSLFANYATIEQLEARDVYISNLYADYADITNLLAGNIGASNLEAIHLTGDNVVIDDAIITDAMIVDLTADKITAGTIYTARVKIQTDEGDSSLYLGDSLIQMSDSNIIRLQLGKDANGLYNFYIFNEDGDLMWNALGVTAEGIGNEVIVDTHVADNANIAGYKLDIDSVVSCINDNGNIQVDGSHVTINGDTLNYQLDTIIEEIANIELDTEGLKWFTPYYAVNNSDTEPPLGNEEIYPAYADEALVDYSFVDVYDVDTYWTTEELQPADGQYLWIRFFLEYTNGDTGWSDPICLTDGYVRKVTTTIQTELEVVQGQITAKVWQTDIDKLGSDIETKLTDQWSTFTEEIGSITASVGILETDVSNEFSSLWSSMSEFEMKIDSISLSVTDSNYGSASIILSVNGEPTGEEAEIITNAREAFAAEDETSVIVQGGTIEFWSGTLIIDSNNFKLDSLGNVSMYGATAENLEINGDSLFHGVLQATEITLEETNAYLRFGHADNEDRNAITPIEIGYDTGYDNDIWTDMSITNDGLVVNSHLVVEHNNDDGGYTLGDGIGIQINPFEVYINKQSSDFTNLGVLTIESNAGSLPLIYVSNNTESTDTKITAHSWSGNSIWFGVGSGGTNRGVYDPIGSAWLVYADSNNYPHLGASTVGSSSMPIYLSSGRPIACTLSNVIKVSSISEDNITVGSESYFSGTISSSLSGYTPIGIAGWQIGNGSTNGTRSSKCMLCRLNISGTTAYYQINNYSSAGDAKVKLTVYVLYIASS